MNWFDGIVLDRVWVGHSRIWKIEGMEGIPYIKPWKSVLVKRSLAMVLYLVVAPVIAGLVGLIPNCAASVVLTQLYLEGMINGGAMMAGLLAGAGVGLLVLFRVNENVKENLRIALLLYIIGVVSGILIETAGLIF